MCMCDCDKLFFIGTFLFCIYGCNLVNQSILMGQKLEVNLLVPEQSGFAFVQYKSYKVKNDSLFVIDKGQAFLEKKNLILERYSLTSKQADSLAQMVKNLDSIGQQVSKCREVSLGRTRFFMTTILGDTIHDGYIAHVYRTKIFAIIDLLNSIYPKGNIINYQKNDLLGQEKKCH